MPAKRCSKCGSFMTRDYVRKQKRFKGKGHAGGVESYGVLTGYHCKRCGNKVKK